MELEVEEGPECWDWSGVVPADLALVINHHRDFVVLQAVIGRCHSHSFDGFLDHCAPVGHSTRSAGFCAKRQDFRGRESHEKH